VICTLYRAGPLRDAIRSARAQVPPEGARAEVLRVDNSPDATVRAGLETLLMEPGLPLPYASLPRPSISLARNHGVAESRRGGGTLPFSWPAKRTARKMRLRASLPGW